MRHVIDRIFLRVRVSVFSRERTRSPGFVILNVATSTTALNHSVCLQMKTLSPACHQLENTVYPSLHSNMRSSL